MRQLLLETAVLAGFGGGAGVGVAAVGIRLLTSVVDLRLPVWMAVALDWRVIAFLLAAASTSALLAGLFPALRLSRPDVTGDLKESSRGASSGVGHQRMRQALIVGEVAIATMLLAGAGLMVRTVQQLQRVDLGFNPDRLLTFRVELGWRAYDSIAKSVRFYSLAKERLAALPGVEAVGLDSNLALSGKPRDPSQIALAGQPADREATNPFVNAHWISPGFFTTMGIPIPAGRAFTDDDRDGSQPVAMVSQRFAERFFPGESAISKQIAFALTANRRWMTIVGVTGNVRHQNVTAGEGLDLYLPYQQANVSGVYFVVRANGDPRRLAPSLSSIVWGIDPNQSFFDVRPMEDRIATIVWHQRAAGWLFGCFAGLALVLAASGLYAVLSYAVSQQTRELAVRIALGARPRELIALVLARTLGLVGIGLALGLGGAAIVARAIGGLLFGIAGTDVVTFASVPIVLTLVALLAASVPVRRATRVDPLVALRAE